MYNKQYELYENPQIQSYIDLVSIQYEKHRDKVAFAWYNKNELQKATYGDFANDICILAGKIELKTGQGKHIGVIGENSYDWLVVYLAIIFSGNVAVLLDKDMSEDELSDCVERMDISILLSDAANVGKCKNLHVSVGVEDFAGFQKRDASGATIKSIKDYRIENHDKVCSIFLTSGTTSKRKGVMLTHRNIATDINETCKLLELTGHTLAVLPFHHAYGLVAAVWLFFNYGHTVYISQGLRRLQKELTLVKPKTLMLVPLFVESFLKQIRMSVKNDNRKKEIIDSFGGELEYIICGGAPLDPIYVKEFRSYGIEVLNGYGTTECSPVVAVNRNHYFEDDSVGIPLPNSRVKISSDGEIMISGDHVMAGYYNEPEETEAVMEDGWYKTGDLGEINDKGFIRITGRKKNLIILSSGENISPEEIEERLMRIDGIDEVLVKAEDNELTAEIYAKDADAKMREKIQNDVDGLNRSVPMYKRVTRVRFRSESFPKTTTSKIIRG